MEVRGGLPPREQYADDDQRGSTGLQQRRLFAEQGPGDQRGNDRRDTGIDRRAAAAHSAHAVVPQQIGDNKREY